MTFFITTEKVNDFLHHHGVSDLFESTQSAAFSLLSCGGAFRSSPGVLVAPRCVRCVVKKRGEGTLRR